MRTVSVIDDRQPTTFVLSVAALLLAAAVAVAVIQGLILWLSPLVNVSFSENEVQRAVETQMPKRKCVASACVELSALDVGLAAGRIKVQGRIGASMGSVAQQGNFEAFAVPFYDKSRSAFVLRDIEVVSIGLAGQEARLGRQSFQAELLKSVLGQVTVYEVRADSMKGFFLQQAIQSVDVFDGQVRVSVKNPLLLLPLGA